MVCLVDEDGDVFRNPVEQLPHLVLRDEPARRVVRVAEVHEADVAMVLARRADHRRNVLPEVRQQRQLDDVGLERRRVRVEDVVRRIHADEQPSVLQERRAADVEDLAGARAEQNVLGLDAMMLRDLLGEATVRIPVAIGVLHGPRHCLHDGLGRPVRVLVVRELRVAVVVLFRAERRRLVHAAHAARPERGAGRHAHRT